jgi:hypothetical protein
MEIPVFSPENHGYLNSPARGEAGKPTAIPKSGDTEGRRPVNRYRKVELPRKSGVSPATVNPSSCLAGQIGRMDQIAKAHIS